MEMMDQQIIERTDIDGTDGLSMFFLVLFWSTGNRNKMNRARIRDWVGFFTINLIDGLVSLLESKFVTSKFVGELYPGVNVENDVEN